MSQGSATQKHRNRRTADQQQCCWVCLQDGIRQSRKAIPDFLCGWFAILRRAAAHNIRATVIVAAPQALFFQQMVQHAPGPANEAFAFAIFVSAWGLADNQ